MFDTNTRIPAERLTYALNALLPEDVTVVRSEEVPAGWHPRKCVSVKTYEYRILNREFPDPVRRRDTYFVSFRLDIERMRRLHNTSSGNMIQKFLQRSDHGGGYGAYDL